MNKVFAFTSIVIFAALTSNAAPASKKTPVVSPPELSTREEALKETSSIDEKSYKKTIQASEAQQANVKSFLNLQDPTPELRDRPWLWSFALKMQSFQPQGLGRVSNTTFELSDYGNTVMPSVQVGFLVTPLRNDIWNWDSGLAGHVGYSAQTTNLITPSGYSFDDARLTSGLVSLVWNNRITNLRASKWSAIVAPEFGIVNYTQTATNNAQANFNQQNEYLGAGLGLEYAFSKKWGAVVQYSYRQASGSKKAQTDLQTNNFEVGTSVVW